MIMTVAELRQYITTDETDPVLEARLQALELAIRAYTNNNFQVRAFRAVVDAVASGKTFLISGNNPFKANDTLQITDSELNEGLVNIRTSSNGVITVKEDLYDEASVTITKVVYPADVKLGVANMLQWDINNRDKAGIASETISRHSVTYVDQTAANTLMGYPASLMGFLRPYKKARFGKGFGV